MPSPGAGRAALGQHQPALVEHPLARPRCPAAISAAPPWPAARPGRACRRGSARSRRPGRAASGRPAGPAAPRAAGRGGGVAALDRVRGDPGLVGQRQPGARSLADADRQRQRDRGGDRDRDQRDQAGDQRPPARSACCRPRPARGFDGVGPHRRRCSRPRARCGSRPGPAGSPRRACPAPGPRGRRRCGCRRGPRSPRPRRAAPPG